MKEILLQEVSSPGCHQCKVFEEFWHSIEKDWPNVHYKKIDVTSSDGQELVSHHMIFASPGIILNGELFASGGVNGGVFIKKLKELSL